MRIGAAVEADDHGALAEAAHRAPRDMHRLVDAASAIINGAARKIDQSEIDQMSAG